MYDLHDRACLYSSHSLADRQTDIHGMDCTLESTDRLSSTSLLMGMESNFGAADAGASVTWPGAEVAARLRPLPNCSPVLHSLDPRVLEPADCFMAQSPPGLISHRFWDMVTYWLKIANFPYPLSFSTPARGDPFQVHKKALRILKLESSRQPPTVKIWWS